MLMLSQQPNLETLDCVLAFAGTQSLSRYLAFPLLAPREGIGALPLDLGLKRKEFNHLVDQYFPGLGAVIKGIDRRLATEVIEHSQIRQELSALRKDEIDELVDLLEEHRAPGVDPAISVVVASSCLGGDHLWRDMGFPSREELSHLMSVAYPALKAKNDKDMKWKRFFYKQLCEKGGGYVCRAPSCDQCSAYQDCFGPED